jgi:hypothetical protein
MRSDTDSGAAQPANGREPALNEHVVATRDPHALRAGPFASADAVRSPIQGYCVSKGGW